MSADRKERTVKRHVFQPALLMLALTASGASITLDDPTPGPTTDTTSRPEVGASEDGAPALAGEQPGEHRQAASELDYRASLEVIPAEAGATAAAQADTIDGLVFYDRNQDGQHQERSEPGIEDVRVTNGREVVLTDEDGRYSLPVDDDMALTVSKPANYMVPMDEDNIPQMSYQHKPEGSPDLRFGGLEPTGPLPEAVNFPMLPTRVTDEFSCAALGDVQTYSGNEVGYARDSAVADLLGSDLSEHECMLLLGDVAGDDLGLYPRIKNTMSAVGLPQYWTHGNHDLDFDATTDEDSADTYRREYGPAYYSFDIGQVHFVVLDNVVYPCTEEDRENGRTQCGDPDDTAYNGRVTDQQMEWLANDLATVPEDKLVVLNHHIPMLSFVDNEQVIHQTDNAADIYELLEGREALSLSGHTHTIEQLLPDEEYAGWQEAVGVEEAPFHHLVAGAVSGNWYTGELDRDGIPEATGRLGEPRGYFTIDFDGASYEESFHASGQADRQMALSFNTPQFREWYDQLWSWHQENPPTTDEIPPVNVNDLPDLHLFTPRDLRDGVSLTANVWAGSRDSEVSVRINGGEPLELERTQEGRGEEVLLGVEYADPAAVVRQLQVARYAYQSTSGNEDAQGWQAYSGSQFGPGAPQSIGLGGVANKSSHLWTVPLPRDLPTGTHVADVTSVDRYGNPSTDQVIFEVREERPEQFWREGPWEDSEG